MRHLIWFSCGAPSAVAAKLIVQEHPDTSEVVYCDTGGEHPDNARFLRDVAKWLRRDVTVLKNPRYANHLEVAEKQRYINGPSGAKCTFELKRRLREQYQRPDDIHVWGFTNEEKTRAADFEEHHPDLKCLWPLIEADLGRQDCLALIARAGIEIPEMYKLGYKNNNCIGCWKGGMGYWNKIRVDFPEVFAEAARIARSIGRSPFKVKDGVMTHLDELDPKAGRYSAEPDISCGLACFRVDEQITKE